MTDKNIDVVAGIIQKDRHVLVSKRPENTHLAGYWEFPGGKPKPGESDSEALRREFREELGITISVDEPYFSVTHNYDEKTVHLAFYTCTKQENTKPEPLECEDVRWVLIQDLNTLTFPPADEEILNKLQSESAETN